MIVLVLVVAVVLLLYRRKHQNETKDASKNEIGIINPMKVTKDEEITTMEKKL